MENISKNHLGHFGSMAAYGVAVAAAMAVLGGLDRLYFEVSTMELFLLSLAVFRLTHLFVYDIVTDFIRDYFSKFEKGFGKTLGEILGCPWCTGVWMALLVGFFYLLSPVSMVPIFLVALAGMGSILQIVSIYIVRLTPSQYKKEIEEK